MARPRKYKDEDLLEKAMCLFWERGYKNTSLKDLEKSLNLTAPSIYHNFGSKETLFIKALDNYLDTVVDGRIDQLLNTQNNPIENIKTFFLSLTENSASNNSNSGCLLTNTATELGNSIPQVTEKIQDGLNRIENAFHATLTLAKTNKQLSSTLSIDDIASSLLVGFQGLLVMVKLNYSQSKLNQTALSTLKVLDA